MEINKVPIKDVCNFEGGSQPPKETFKSEIQDGYIRLIQTRDYKADKFLTFIPIHSTRKFCTKQDIMIGRYGPPVFQILRGLEGAYNVALMKAIPKSNILNDYLYYFLKQEFIHMYISVRTRNHTLQLTSRGDMAIIPFHQKLGFFRGAKTHIRIYL